MEANEKANILLVDDNPAKLLTLQTILADLNQNLVAVNSGTEALRLLLHQDFSVILLDVSMPVMDGFETAALIRQRPQSEHTPIIFVTAFHTAEVDMAKGYSLGAVDYIFAPVVPEILRVKVGVFVDLFRMRRAIEDQAKELAALNQELAEQLHQVQRLNQQLEVTNQELEAFSYSVSHDLRAPLQILGGFSEILLEDHADKLDAQGKEHLQRIRAASQRMAELIDALLKLSRVTRAEMSLEPVDLSALAQMVGAELQQAQPERQVEFVAQEGLVAQGDPKLLRAVMDNLLRNAWKYTGKQPHPRIEFGAMPQEDGKLAYFVRDNGVGFDMAFADKLFRAFQRLHTDKEFPGIGIGLATVQRIIHRHGGHIWAEGAVERGATFYFTL